MQLHSAAIAAKADSALARKVYVEQTEHVKEACRDHELAKKVELEGDAVLHQEQPSLGGLSVATQLVCGAFQGHFKETLSYASALSSPSGLQFLHNHTICLYSFSDHVTKNLLYGHAQPVILIECHHTV